MSDQPAVVYECPHCGGGVRPNPQDPVISIAEHDRVVAERDRLREALIRIRDHGKTHDEPCWAISKGDCVDKMQEIARAVLAVSP